ncbi:hypothetical protein PFNF135_02443 [Plasmodium falciparum NF135/5.C10]|uniref:Uncharacterized protein n=2 Tax=Plasmodium falciparum TaxID=5833 RepID=A0A024V5X0_PLAFA|nr:hypothetical protein PFFVO_02323 [Plasmodium falciparum Vietnam Oak-Knoll (FVO)]ETW42968.1 hypothetical protein PFNF135_02443 [Plasmodium falciparum NF135/5.C10]
MKRKKKKKGKQAPPYLLFCQISFLTFVYLIRKHNKISNIYKIYSNSIPHWKYRKNKGLYRNTPYITIKKNENIYPFIKILLKS